MNPSDAASAIDDWIGYAVTICREWGRLYPWLEADFISDALLSLWKAFLTYDPLASGEIVPPFVAVIVKRACWTRLSIERKKNPTAFHSRPGTTASGEQFDPLTLIAADGPEVGIELEIEDLLRLLPEERRGLVKRVVMGEETLSAIAVEDGVTHEAIRGRLERCLTTMRAAVLG